MSKENPQHNPQQRAKIEQMKKAWAQKRAVSENLDSIANKIGVYSGKGGVGKTTVTINLATTLADQGAKVGVLDVDIDCPNVVKVMNVTERPLHGEANRIIPPEKFGVKVMSMGFFQQNEDEAIIMRGPMIHNAINQLLQLTEWGDLDYLLVDLPPGTSDSPLTVMQTMTLDGFVVVTTPQDLANLDAKRSINMIRKLKLDVLGVIENFSGGVFGSGGGANLAEQLEVMFLGDISLRAEYQDISKPTVLTDDSIMDEYKVAVDKTKEALNLLKAK